MSEQKPEAIFLDGVFIERPREGAPDFVKGKLSFNAHKFVPFLKKHMNAEGYINADLKVSRAGKLYIQLNTWKPSQEKMDEVKESLQDEDNIGW